jgi:CTP synthase (UTP-ammonia lyase)
VITPVMCALENRAPGKPKLSGHNKVRVIPHTRLAAFMGAGEHAEGYFCNYEANAEFMPRFEAAGLRVDALGPQGELRGIEIPGHPFFIATLFQPQLTSKWSGRPHPLIKAYLLAVQGRSRAAAVS